MFSINLMLKNVMCPMSSMKIPVIGTDHLVNDSLETLNPNITAGH